VGELGRPEHTKERQSGRRSNSSKISDSTRWMQMQEEDGRVGCERRQESERWSCAICLARWISVAARAMAVPILLEVDKLQWVASGCWSNARANHGENKCWLVGWRKQRGNRSGQWCRPQQRGRNCRHRSRLIRFPQDVQKCQTGGGLKCQADPPCELETTQAQAFLASDGNVRAVQLVENKRDDGTAASSLIDDSRQIHRCATRSWQV
jgi:hypothetical protein